MKVIWSWLLICLASLNRWLMIDFQMSKKLNLIVFLNSYSMIGWGRKKLPICLSSLVPNDLSFDRQSPRGDPPPLSSSITWYQGAWKGRSYWPLAGGMGTGGLHSFYPPNRLKYILHNIGQGQLSSLTLGLCLTMLCAMHLHNPPSSNFNKSHFRYYVDRYIVQATYSIFSNILKI